MNYITRKGEAMKNKLVIGFLTMSICVGVAYIASPFFSDPEFRQLQPMIPKDAVAKDQVVVEEPTIVSLPPESQESNSSTGQVGEGNVQVQLGAGNLVTDPAKNPNGIPLYDGYTLDAPHYDVDYSRFWTATGPLEGLGDWTYRGSQARNRVSHEFAADSLSSFSEGKKLFKRDGHEIIGGVWTSKGRIGVALPYGVLVEPSQWETVKPKIKDRSQYTLNDKGSAAMNDSRFGVTVNTVGTRVDCVLADGTVIPFVVMDVKGLHVGNYNNGSSITVCDDTQHEGYCQYRATPDKSYETRSIIEIGVSKETGKAARNGRVSYSTILNLTNNKIVSFRVYPN